MEKFVAVSVKRMPSTNQGSLTEGKAQYCKPPCTKFRSAAFQTETKFAFLQNNLS